MKEELNIRTDTSEPLRGRDELNLNGPSLLAASKNVSNDRRKALEATMRRCWKNEVIPVKKWSDWQRAVQAKKPALFMALPHTFGTGSHIGMEISNDQKESQYIDRSYVAADGKSRPVVFLIGCDVAGAADPSAYTNHVAVFRDADAALVVGTIATVWGPDAARVAQRFFPHLARISGESRERFGEILRKVKREAMADGFMLALCLVAFGDADWYLNNADGL